MLPLDVDKELAKIKANHKAIQRALERPKCSEFVMPDNVYLEQIGLRPVYCDRLGRLWDVSTNPIKRIYPPPTKKDKT